jgi:hypothetical protein
VEAEITERQLSIAAVILFSPSSLVSGQTCSSLRFGFRRPPAASCSPDRELYYGAWEFLTRRLAACFIPATDRSSRLTKSSLPQKAVTGTANLCADAGTIWASAGVDLAAQCNPLVTALSPLSGSPLPQGLWRLDSGLGPVLSDYSVDRFAPANDPKVQYSSRFRLVPRR